jgi:hypothetical protein
MKAQPGGRFLEWQILPRAAGISLFALSAVLAISCASARGSSGALVAAIDGVIAAACDVQTALSTLNPEDERVLSRYTSDLGISLSLVRRLVEELRAESALVRSRPTAVSLYHFASVANNAAEQYDDIKNMLALSQCKTAESMTGPLLTSDMYDASIALTEARGTLDKAVEEFLVAQRRVCSAESLANGGGQAMPLLQTSLARMSPVTSGGPTSASRLTRPRIRLGPECDTIARAGSRR